MKSLYLHYKNKYPGGQVRTSEQALDVYSASGEHVVALRRDGAGSLVDQSEALGLRDRHDLAPIPKDARVFKLVEGKIGKSEEAAEREKLRDGFLCPEKKDVVLSCKDLEKHGHKFDEKQRAVK